MVVVILQADNDDEIMYISNISNINDGVLTLRISWKSCLVYAHRNNLYKKYD